MSVKGNSVDLNSERKQDNWARAPRSRQLHLPQHQQQRAGGTFRAGQKWFPPLARRHSASVHPASLHFSAATRAASVLQLQHQERMAAAKTEMILPALQLSEPLSFPHSPMDNYPKLEEVMMLSSAGTPFHTASAPESAGFGSGEPGEQYDHLAGGKNEFYFIYLIILFLLFMELKWKVATDINDMFWCIVWIRCSS